MGQLKSSAGEPFSYPGPGRRGRVDIGTLAGALKQYFGTGQRQASEAADDQAGEVAAGDHVPGAGRVGHGIGLDLTEPPHLSEADQTVLQPGMVISIEPGIATDYGVFHIEENVIATSSGHDVISVAPWQLTTLTA